MIKEIIDIQLLEKVSGGMKKGGKKKTNQKSEKRNFDDVASGLNLGSSSKSNTKKSSGKRKISKSKKSSNRGR